MDGLLDQLTRIRSIQAESGSGPYPKDLPNQLAFALEVAAPSTVKELAQDIARFLPDIEVVLEPLFEADSAPQHFILPIPGVSFSNLDGSEFEIMYALQAASSDLDGLRLVHVEPALEIGFTDLQLDEIAEPEAPVIKASGCF